MANKEHQIYARVCVEIVGRLDAPLLVSSGEKELTDKDLLVTKDGIAFLPGSSLAGALRSYICGLAGVQTAEELFGTLGWGLRPEDEKREEEPEYQSRIIVYDTMLPNGSVTRRDGVRLDEHKTAEDTSKYDMQAVETGAEFRIRLELCVRETYIDGKTEEILQRDLNLIKSCAAGFQNGSLRLGSGSRRGFGKLAIEKAGYCVFRMKRKEELEAWLDWDWNTGDVFTYGEEWSFKELLATMPETEHCFTVPLKIKGTLLIRDYGFPAWGKKWKVNGLTAPDYGQLTLRDGGAVIPGTAWAGAVRGYLAGLVKDAGGYADWEDAQKALDRFFGTWSVKDGDVKYASVLIFEESRVKDGNRLPAVRNAVDRFSGGSVKGALYSEVCWAGGEVEWTVRWSAQKLNELEQKALCGLLLWAAFGMKNGFLTIGGETGVGRGLLEQRREPVLDGRRIKDQEQFLKAAVQWCRER